MALKARLAVLLAGLLCSAAAQATIVVANDEWTLSNTGFANNANTTQFVSNLVGEFGPNIHAYSSNFGFTQSALQTAMNNAGATYTHGTGITFDLATLSGYDAVFFGGFYLNAGQTAVLHQYVAAGGSVYIVGGTAAGGGAAFEASQWNGFLSVYGVSMANVYNGISGNPAVGGDPIFSGVSSLYQNNGNSLSGTGVLAGGLYAVIRPNAVPVPGGLALFGAALIAMALGGRKRS